MARGDIKIDYNTNDLRIENSSSNVYNEAIFNSDADPKIVITIPFSHTSDAYKSYQAHIKVLPTIDVSFDADPIKMAFAHIDENGLHSEITQLFNVSILDVDGVPTNATVLELKTLAATALAAGEALRFSYRDTSVDPFSVYFCESKMLGDFVASGTEGENITQNEYIILNINEGSLLQDPLQGVGIQKYIQSPSSNQDIINEITEKLALDALTVIGLEIVGSKISIKSEDQKTDV